LTAHTHHPVRRAIFILLALTTFAWLVLTVADPKSAAPNTPTPPSTIQRYNQTPGSSLEGINEPLSQIIWYNGAQAAEEQRAAERRAVEAEAARRRQAAASRPAPVAPRATSPRNTQCPADIVALIEKHWSRFGADVVQWAIGIAWRESNCRPDVTSPTRCAGIFQTCVPLHGGLYAAAGYDWRTAAWQAEPNIIVAANLYAGSGPSPWRL
jgi:hypothetical protein